MRLPWTSGSAPLIGRGNCDGCQYSINYAEYESMKDMDVKKYLTLVAFVMASGSAFADSAEVFQYASIGTAFKFVSTTTSGVTSTSQVVAFTSTTVPSVVYRVVCNTDTHINMETAGVVTPTATTSNSLFPAYSPEYIIVGKSQNIAVVRSSADGTCWIARTGR